MPPDGTPSIYITSLESTTSSSSFIQPIDLCFAGLALPPTLDALGNIIPQESLSSLPSTSSIRQSSRVVRHAAISSSEGSDGGSSRVLVAYKSDKIPMFYGQEDGNTAGSVVQQLTGLPDPLNPSTSISSAGLTGFENLSNATEMTMQGVSGINIPSVAPDIPLQSSLFPASIATSNQSNPTMDPNAASNTFYTGDPYADINMSALDDLLDFQFNASDPATATAVTEFDAFMSGADLNSSGASASSLALPLASMPEPPPPLSEEKTNPSDSPGKGSMTEGGWSPKKSSTGHGLEAMGGETGPDQLPREKLENQIERDREEGMIQLWEVVINWEGPSAYTSPSKRSEGSGC